MARVKVARKTPLLSVMLLAMVTIVSHYLSLHVLFASLPSSQRLTRSRISRRAAPAIDGAVETTSVAVRGFDFGTSKESIMEFCGQVGSVVDFEFNGKDGGSALVTYSSSAEASRAVAQLNRKKIKDNERYVDVALRTAVAQRNAIFLKGFDFGTTEEAIRKHCEKAGKVIEVEFFGNGNALVSYASEKEAASAAASLQATTIAGNTRYIDVNLDRGLNTKQYPIKPNSVFVRGFDLGTTLDAIKDHFAQAGSIVEAELRTPRIAFLTYSSLAEAEAAASSLDKSTIPGNERYIDARIATVWNSRS